MSDRNTKLTLDALIARKAQRDEAKMEFKDVYFERLGGCLTFKKLPLLKVIDLVDGADGTGLRESLEMQVQLIYRCCPVMQDKRLQAEYECDEPTDIVCGLFEDDLGAIAEASAAILDFYGMGESVREQLKN